MRTAYCLDCDRSIKLGDRFRVGDTVDCTHCEAEFQLVSLEPPEIEWLYEDEDDDWEEEEEEEEEEAEDYRSWQLAKRSRINAFDQKHARNHSRGGPRKYEYEYEY